VLSGYFAPYPSQVPTGNKPGGRPHDVNVFLHRPALLARNTPDQYILKIPIGLEVPQFWLAAGGSDAQDVQAAQYFQQLLLTRVANVPLMIVPNGGHTAPVWRAAFRPMLAWMTTQLALEVQHFAQVDRQRAEAAHGVKPGPHRIPVKASHAPTSRPTALSSGRNRP
jgi:hypothetical protein